MEEDLNEGHTLPTGASAFITLLEGGYSSVHAGKEGGGPDKPSEEEEGEGGKDSLLARLFPCCFAD
jgi:hypothetical protein